MNQGGGELVWSKWQWRGLLLLTLLIGTFALASSVSHLARASGILRDWPLAPYITLDRPEGGWLRVVDVEPGGAAERAGLQAGDRVRAVVPGIVPGMVLAPGASLPVVVQRDGARFTTEIVSPLQPQLPGIGVLVLASQGLAGIVSTILGVLLVLLRGRRNRAAAMLGMLLQCLGWSSGGYGMLWSPAAEIFALALVLGTLATAGLCLFLPLAGLELAGGRGTKSGRRITALAAILAVTVAIAMQSGTVMGGQPAMNVIFVGIMSAAAVCVWWIARNYRQSDAVDRNRNKIVLTAFAGYAASFLLFVWFIAAGQSPQLWAIIVGSAVVGLIGPSLIAYAMFRKRLFDLNFALNRTLVYGTVSFVLLAAFGIAKWVLEHLIPEAWHEGSEFYNFGIALALFLSLHRVHDWVEHNVERVFFRRWHRNEAELRRFVAAAAHYDDAAALCRGFAGELSRFAQGAASALYSRDADGVHRLRAGGLAGAEATLDSGDHAIALMRAERQPVDLARARSGLPGALALPMLDQGRLSGLALLAAKPDGAGYRPDEIEVLGWAAHQVGLDLQAIGAHELEAKLADYAREVAALKAENARLSGLPARRKLRSTA